MAKVAILGFGTVGSGVYDIISGSDFSQKIGEEILVKKVLDIRDFPNHPHPEIFTKEFDDILNDDEIGFVAETMGGLHPAYEFTKSLLEKGKCVTTSNKELVATYGAELLQLAKNNNARYIFEASVGGGIPIIRPLSSCLQANTIEKIAGILNGTTNFILTEMIERGSEFETALSEAQAKGYAERNPAADVEGYDACRKISILSSMAWGGFADYNDISTEGITNITKSDVELAEKLGYKIKLIGYAQREGDKKAYACVAPMLVKNDILLSEVKDVFNAIMVSGDFLGDAMFFGKGAGKLATASAVVADIIDMVKKSNADKFSLLWNEKIEISNGEDKKWDFFVSDGKSGKIIKNVSEKDINKSEYKSIIKVLPWEQK